MTAPAPRQEYIITEEQLHEFQWRCTTAQLNMDSVAKIIRFRPAQSPIPNDEQCRICSQSERDSERHRVMLEVDEFLKDFGFVHWKDFWEDWQSRTLRSSPGSREP